jgi:hypothetical protein
MISPKLGRYATGKDICFTQVVANKHLQWIWRITLANSQCFIAAYVTECLGQKQPQLFVNGIALMQP